MSENFILNSEADKVVQGFQIQEPIISVEEV
jgi:hypothetical protein